MTTPPIATPFRITTNPRRIAKVCGLMVKGQIRSPGSRRERRSCQSAMPATWESTVETSSDRPSHRNVNGMWRAASLQSPASVPSKTTGRRRGIGHNRVTGDPRSSFGASFFGGFTKHRSTSIGFFVFSPQLFCHRLNPLNLINCVGHVNPADS